MQRFLYAAAAIISVAIFVGLISRGSFSKAASPAVVARLGTGTIAGLYFPLGGAIARFVAEKKESYGFWIAPEATSGSAENIQRVLAGELELGIAQADALHAAYLGEGDWYSAGPQKELRAIASLHDEAVVLVVHETAKIKSLEDLRGKHISLGQGGSGTRSVALALLKSVAIDPAGDLQGEAWSFDEVAKHYLNGAVDGFFYVGAIPNETLTAAFARKGTALIPLQLSAEKAKEYPFLTTTTVNPVLFAAGAAKTPIQTLGVRAILFAHSKYDSRQGFGVASQLFQHDSDLAKMHPGFRGVSQRTMVEGVPIPFHEGALRYFAQAGIQPRAAQ